MTRAFLRRAAPLAVIAAAMVAAYALGLHTYLSFDALAAHRDTLTALADTYPVLAVGGFIVAYATATALSLPGGAVLTILGGFLFGTWLGGAAAAVGATLGATGLFVAARAGLGDLADRVSGPHVHDMREIDERGVRAVMADALARADAEGAHLHVSFDVDMLDPYVAPGVGTRVKGGPTYREAQLCMEMIHDTGLVGSVDVVELNPAFDTHNATAETAVEMLKSLFGERILARMPR